MNDRAAQLKASTAINRALQRKPNPDAADNQLLRNSRNGFGQLDMSKVAAKMRKATPEAVSMAAKSLTPVQQGELARKVDVSKLSANGQPVGRAIEKPLTPVQRGELARSGGDVAAYAAIKQNLTPVQKGEIARTLDAAAVDRAPPTQRSLNLVSATATPSNLNAVKQSETAPLSPTLYSASYMGNGFNVSNTYSNTLAPSGVDGFGITLTPGVGVNPGVILGDGDYVFSPTLGPGGYPGGILGDGDYDFSPTLGPGGYPGGILGDGDYDFPTTLEPGGYPEGILGDGDYVFPGEQRPPEANSPPINSPSSDVIDTARGEITAKATEENLVNELTEIKPSTAEGISDTPGNNAFREYQQRMSGLSAEEFAKVELAFDEGLVEGVGKGALGLATSVGTVVANTAQFIGDESVAGLLGDELRGITGGLPKWLDEVVPSEKRGEETIQYTEHLASNLAGYVATSRLNPSQVSDDVGEFLAKEWGNLEAGYEAAKAQGPEAEAKWWGETIGEAGFEIATLFVPGADVAEAVETVDAAALASEAVVAAGEAAQGAEVVYSAETLGSISNAASKASELADAALNDPGFGYSMIGNIEETSEYLNDIVIAGPDAFGSTPEAQAAYDDVVEAQLELQKAERSIATPIPKGAEAGVPDLTVTLNAQETNLLNDLQNIGDEVQYQNYNITAANLANVTRATGNEFAVFKNASGDTYVLRGDAHGIDLDDNLKVNLIQQGYELQLHSQTGYSLNELHASYEDQQILRDFDQDSSAIVNSNGDTSEFTQTESRQNIVENVLATPVNLTSSQFNQLAINPQFAPNTRYIVRDNNALTTDGSNFTEYHYITDSRGDLTRIEGQLKRVENRPNPRPNAGLQTTIGNEGVQSLPGNANLPKSEKDVGFHVLGDQFGGDINRFNVVPGNSKLNGGTRGGWGYLENKLSERLARPSPGANNTTNIDFVIELEREPGPTSNRPSHFVYNYSINGGPQFTDRYENVLPIPGVTGSPLLPP